MLRPTNKSYGPFQVIDIATPECQTLFTLPWALVVGCHVLIRVDDNFARQLADPEFNTSTNPVWATAEVALFGTIQGIRSTIHRVQTSSSGGPVSFVFPAEMMYTDLEVAARNMTGGHRGPANVDPGEGALTPNGANGFSIEVTATFQPVDPKAFQSPAAGYGYGG